jgi:hypothetical protein
MVIYDGCETDYHKVVKQLFAAHPPGKYRLDQPGNIPIHASAQVD